MAVKARLDVFATSLPGEVRAFLERVRALPGVARVVALPDVHLAGEACVGTAIATRATLRPFLLGSDLGCGVAAMRLGDARQLDGAEERVLRGLQARIPLLAHPRDALPELSALSIPALSRAAERDGAREHGTIGRGNHFVELQEDEEGVLWAMVHSGSRAMGPLIQAAHCRGQRPKDVVLDAESDAGRAYLGDVAWAVRFAETSRARMLDRIAEVIDEELGHASGERLDCHHDAIAHELHGGERLWVHRKGAVPAPEGAPVLVPGSMGTASYHAIGRGEPDALASSAHGAGRALPRGAARRAISEQRLIDELGDVVVDRRRLAELRDEAPSAYKDVTEVMRAQRALVKQVRLLRPRLVHK